MLDTLRKRLGSEKGFTLIELLVVIIILGILLAIAIPSYLSFRDRANNSAAQADIRAAIPGVEQYYADNGSLGYTNLSMAALTAIDAGIKPLDHVTGAATTYCLDMKVGTGQHYWKNGPGADIVPGTCP